MNERGQSMIIFLLITLTMMSMFYLTVKALSDTMKIAGKDVTLESRLNDLANSIANDLTGSIVFLPHNVTLHYKKKVPSDIAGESFSVEYRDEKVVLRSGEVEVSVFLSGIKYEVEGSIDCTGVGEIWIDVKR